MGKRNKPSNNSSESKISKIKKQNCGDTDTNTEINSKLVQADISLQDKKNKSRKKNKTQARSGATEINRSVFVENENVKAEEAELVESITPPVQNKKVKSKNKNKGNINHDNQDTSEVIFEESVTAKPEGISTVSSKKIKTKKRNKTHSDNDEAENNKKIKLADDGPIEINAQRQNNKALSQEDDIKDEDIDKFCDEINEEDNAMYEDWVKSVEAKLSSSNIRKRKPKPATTSSETN